MDPKGKGMVVNDKEKESFLNEPRDYKPTDSGSSHKKKTGRRRGASRRSSTTTATSLLLPQETTTTTRKRNRLTQTIHLIILVFLLIPMLIYFQFHLGNLRTLMEKTTYFGVTKCVVTYFLSIQVFGRLLKTECILIVLTTPFSLMSKSIKMHKRPLFC
jgi:hypothetical protein